MGAIRMKGIVRIGIGIVALLLIGGLVSRALESRVQQPIQFNHNLHVEKNGLSCDTCHQYYAEYQPAGIPKIEVCATCHVAPMGQSPEEAKVRSYVEKGKEIPWVKIHNVPDHVYFSHRRHVTLGKVDCQICHGKVKERKTPFEKPVVNIISMDFCINCHKQRKVTNDCAACHK
ncbi:MAG TPA: cytochrome c3 family protein [bacterium]|nr:cytochrome c3 family protein [bacterium]